MTGAATGSAEARLKAKVESILSRSSVPAGDRSDVAEELFAHLWESYENSGGAGLDEDESVDAAIQAFGSSDTIGRSMTRAYHSRLFAATVGELVPAGARASEGPGVVAPTVLFLLALVGSELVFGLQSAAALTPLRAVVVAAALLVFCGTTSIAVVAFTRAQAWSLLYIRVVVLITIAFAAWALTLSPRVVDILGLAALLLAPWVFGRKIGEWVASSPPMTPRVIALIATACCLGGGAFPMAAAMPDPTQAGPQDFRMSIAAVCHGDASRANPAVIDVRATFHWSRLDLLPFGLRGTDLEEGLDGVIAEVGDQPAIGVDRSRESWVTIQTSMMDITGSLWRATDGQPSVVRDDGAIPAGIQMGATTFATHENWGSIEGISFNPAILQGGHAYVVTWHFDLLSSPAASGVSPVIVVRYGHLNRFVSQALATCDEPTGDGIILPNYPPGS